MRSVRAEANRDKIIKKSYSSLSFLPSTNSKTKNAKIKKKQHVEHEQKDKEYVDPEEEYNSADSLDQLLDEDFIPNKTKPDHMKANPNDISPRKNLRSAAGGKRAKAMALMASTIKKPPKKQSTFLDLKQHESNQKHLHSVRKQLHSISSRTAYDSENERDAKEQDTEDQPRPADDDQVDDGDDAFLHFRYITPAIKSKSHHSNFTSLRRSRKVITPTPIHHAHASSIQPTTIGRNSHHLMVTPTKLSACKALETPCTPTPVKLFRTLNVKTPKTKSIVRRDRKLDFESAVKHKNESAQTDKRVIDRVVTEQKQKQRERARRMSVDKLASWKDIEYDGGNAQSERENAQKVDKKENRFESLLRATRVLLLPMKWNILMDKFNALESTLSLYMRKNTFFVHFQNLQNSVQTICKKKFAETDLQQILTVVPDFYHIQWTAHYDKLTQRKALKLTLTAMDYDPELDEQIEQPFDKETQCHSSGNKKGDKVDTDKDTEKNHKLNDNENDNDEPEDNKFSGIGIKFLKVSKLKQRENVFRLRLIQYVAHHHKQWLTENDLIEIEPFETGQWHKRFDLENVEDIKLSPLPLKPKKDIDEIEKMVKEQEEKLKEIIQKEMDKIAKHENEGKEKTMAIPDHLKHLSPSLIAKIRAKQQNKVSAKSIQCIKSKQHSEVDEEQCRLQQLPYLVNLMRGIYVSLKKSSMSCNDLISLIKKRHRNHHLLGEEIWKQLQILDGLKSKFFKIRQGATVKVARLNKSIAVNEVLNEINTKRKK